jgi:hypothetical protein
MGALCNGRMKLFLRRAVYHLPSFLPSFLTSFLSTHLGRYRSIRVFVKHVEGLLERLQLVLAKLVLDIGRG